MMKITDLITAKEDFFLKELEECKKSGFRTFLFGNGIMAKNITEAYKQFNFSGSLVNKKYYSPKEGVYCLEDFFSSNKEKINVVIACEIKKPEEIFIPYASCINKFVNIDSYTIVFSKEYFTYDFIEKSEVLLQKVYDTVYDDESRQALIAFLNQKISKKFGYLEKVKKEYQYFQDFVPLSNEEVFVDCGAFDGDSARDFLEALKRQGKNDYKKIISFEPDPCNYKKLCKQQLTKQECFNMGVADKKDILKIINSGSTGATLSEQGEIDVSIDTLDNVIKDDVTFIKMDIEGSELAALKGAEKIIKKNRPKLAICIYHKNEDLWQIMEYISSIVSNYRFYIRAHERWCTELVLYAIPQ